MGFAPLIIVGMWLGGVRINALPPDTWQIPLTAPDLPVEFIPQGLRFAQSSDQFDEYCASPGQQRDANRQRDADDPYAGDRPIDGKGDPEGAPTDAGKGDKDSEARLRYEDHARLRMQARREGIVGKGAKVVEEDEPDKASAGYKTWRNKKIKANLAATIDGNATDHSTIMTNPMHAEMALAYDVAVGVCRISAEKLREFRVAADWRLQKGQPSENCSSAFINYFRYGMLDGKSASEWIKQYDETQIPPKISDQRANSTSRETQGSNS